MSTIQPPLAAIATLFAALALLLIPIEASAQSTPTTSPAPSRNIQRRSFDINEFQVEGCTALLDIELETALQPFLGPGRVIEDIERARAALEKAYVDKGYQSVSVAIPPQTVREGVVRLKVAEGPVGRLRVRGARYFSPREVKRQAPSLAEGKVPNFNDIARDMLVLNQIPDRKVTPAMHVGVRPGTIDVDLMVDDTLPLHGSIELNNRHGRYTTPLRLSGALRYDNLWQLGHSLAFSYQFAPHRPNDGRVFTASYLARIPNLHWLTITANYLNQNSDVSTIGGVNVAGPGEIAGGRATFTLPGTSGFFHVVTTEFDYKRFGQRIHLDQQDVSSTPVTTWPILAQYSAIWTRPASETQLTLGLTFNLRGVSSSETRFDERRFDSRGDFLYYRGELSRTDTLPFDLQLLTKVQGQYSADPLTTADQFSAGGAESVRGYYESEAVGDYGASGTVEVRSPSLAPLFGKFISEWRFHVFFDAAGLGVHDPLPEQQSRFRLWSTGGGTRVRLFDHLHGELDVAVPLRAEGLTRQYQTRFHFRVAATF